MPCRHPQRGRARAASPRRARHGRLVPGLDDLLALARRQDDVVTVAEAATLGVTQAVLRGRVVSGRWQRAHRGVYVTHNGPPSWRTTARAALAYAGAGAALSHTSAAYLHEFGVARPHAVEVTLPHRRRVEPSPGISFHRALRRDVERRSGLLVVTRAETALDLASTAADADAVVAAVTAAARAGAWPALVADAVGHRPTMPNRSLVLEMVRWAELGVESALELRYHRDVGRRHGLPVARLQRREEVGLGWIRADCIYEGLGVRCELDGELAHPGGRTDSDTWRDNAVLIERGDLTLRYRWRHVAVTPCATAAQVADALRMRGWRGAPKACRSGCPVR